MNQSRRNQVGKFAEELAKEFTDNMELQLVVMSIVFKAVEWADSHPQWYDAQGDNVPEYGREVIVIGRDGKVFYGHRPDPKGYVVVEGEKLFAKTYDKNGWNWPDITLWLDVEIPDELIEQITNKWFEENDKGRH